MTNEVLGIPLAWWAIASAVGFVGTLLLVPIVIVRMRADYFVGEPPPDSFRSRFPVLSFAIRSAKNAVGVALVAVGIALLVLPGQGILTILLGLTLVDFPGKRRLELALLSRKRVRGSLNWVRERFGSEALQLPEV